MSMTTKTVEIVEVLTKKDLAKFIKFPIRFYKDNKAFTPFLNVDEFDLFSGSVKRNPAYEFCETKLFLAYKGGRIVGRIAALINHAYNKKWGKNAIRFTRFDFVDDYEVSSALFDKVVEWGRERGHEEVMGPIGFTDLDHEGMLIEGFDELNMSLTFYNHPYYAEHYDRLGLVKDIDWIEYQLQVPRVKNERLDRMFRHVMDNNNYKIVTYDDRKILREDAYRAFDLIDLAYSKLYGTVPLTPPIVEKTINDFVPIVNMKYVCGVKDENGKVIAFGFLLPSTVMARKKSSGRLLPLGIFRLLKALKGKNDTMEMYIIAVDPELQSHGIPVLIINTLVERLIANDVRICETGPMLETNTAVHSLWSYFDKRQHRRRRCYIKSI